MNEEKLNELRTRIDQLDQRLLELISERAACASEVGQIKKAAGNENCQFYRPDREAQVLRKIAQNNPGPLSNDEAVRLFRELMSACLALEQQMTIAFLGPAGTYTEEAALKHFGGSVQTMPLASIGDVFRQVDAGNASYGVVPVENSTEGVVTHTLDNFMRTKVKIVGEVELPIHHHLMSKQTDIKSIKTLCSHQQSLAQCRNWIEQNLPEVEKNPASSNAQAAMMAAKQDQHAAIASRAAAHEYGLNILASNIEDMPNNSTRFLIVGKANVGPSGSDKTSLLVSALNESGSLHKLLAPFAKHKVSMTRIESRPSQNTNWDYVFFFDLEGHIQDPPLAKALTELQSVATMVSVLGSYPKAVV